VLISNLFGRATNNLVLSEELKAAQEEAQAPAPNQIVLETALDC
jgi:hypothetical protein